MTYLIDTDWVIGYLRGRQDAHTLFHSLSSDGIAISLMTYGEILEGIYFGNNPRQHAQGFQLFLRGVDVLPLTRRIMQRFARIRGDLRQRGMIIGDPDILIAATALHHSLTLVTQNRKHFQRIAGLTLYP